MNIRNRRYIYGNSVSLEMVSFQTQSLSVKTVYSFQNVFIFCVILPIFSILYQIQHYISMFIVLLTKKTVQIIYFVTKTHNFFIIFTFFCKNIERVKMTTIFKYFMFGKYGCLDTGPMRGVAACMYF